MPLNTFIDYSGRRCVSHCCGVCAPVCASCQQGVTPRTTGHWHWQCRDSRVTQEYTLGRAGEVETASVDFLQMSVLHVPLVAPTLLRSQLLAFPNAGAHQLELRWRAAPAACAQRAWRRSARRLFQVRFSGTLSAARLTFASRPHLKIGSEGSIARINVDELARRRCGRLGHSLQTKLRVRVQLARSARRGAPPLL